MPVNANHTLYIAQEELRTVRTQVADLALDTAAYLRYTLRSKPKSEQRRLMRSFGFTFKGGVATDEPELEQPATFEPPATEATRCSLLTKRLAIAFVGFGPNY